MPLTTLERILEKKRALDEKKAEKERKKQEKAEEQKRLKKIEHKKRLKKIQNKKYYKKVREERMKMHEEKGDKRSYHLVLVMKDYKRKKRVGASWWMSSAYEIYNKAIEENQATVKFPVKIYEVDSKNKMNVPNRKSVYEIMILQRTPEGQEVNQFRDEGGKFVPNVIIDNETYTIIAKHEWLVEETFNVYGHHPLKDRKTFEYILNEMVLKDVCWENIKRIYPYGNKMIIQYDSDIDIVTCKTPEECDRLISELQRYTKDNKYIIYTGRIENHNIASDIIEKIQERTGWERKLCHKKVV